MAQGGTRSGVGRSGAAVRKRASSQGRPKRRRKTLLQRADIVEFVRESPDEELRDRLVRRVSWETAAPERRARNRRTD